MIDPDVILKDITCKAKEYFNYSTFTFTVRGLRYESTGNYLSDAITRDNHPIKVVKWFNDFWIYVDIQFQKEPDEIKDFRIFFSLMVFVGKEDDLIKIPLFRAEWDNYENNEYHPQPHWHFYVDSEKQIMMQSFNEMLDGDSTPGFADLLKEELSPKADLNQFHFAMNALWHHSSGGHIHKIDNNHDFTQWFIGLIGHIKHQLEYISK